MKSAWVRPLLVPLTAPTSWESQTVPSGRNHAEHRSATAVVSHVGRQAQRRKGSGSSSHHQPETATPAPALCVSMRGQRTQHIFIDGLVFKVKHFLLFTWDMGTANEGFKEASAGLSQLGDGLGGRLGMGKCCREGLMDLHFPSTLFPWVLRINLFL